MYRSYFVIVVALIFSACATHPSISPVPLKQGETYWGYSLSTENILPVVFMRKGLTDYWDLGLRIGLPIYGTGIDITRLLAEKNNRSDLLNFAYSINPNHNLDFTYYRVNHKVKVNEEKGLTVHRLRYYGLRSMIILSGISGRRSTRFGLLFGGAPTIKWSDEDETPHFFKFQWEIGYFHDFDSMPIRAVLSPLPFDEDHALWHEQYTNYPQKTGGLPSEYSRLTGLSLRLSFPLVNSSTGGGARKEGS